MIALYAGLAALQLAGGYFAAQNTKATADLNNDIADMNSEFAELDAYDTRVEGQSAKARYQSVIDSTLAEQDATLNAVDVDLNYGTTAALRSESKFNSQLNLMEIEKQANQQALGYQRQARDIRLGGTMNAAEAKTRAGQMMFQGVTTAVQTGLTGYKRNQ